MPSKLKQQVRYLMLHHRTPYAMTTEDICWLVELGILDATDSHIYVTQKGMQAIK